MGKVRLFGFYIPSLFLVLAVSEGCVIVGAVVVAAVVRFHGNAANVNEALGPVAYRAILLGFILVLSSAAMGLYQARFREGFIGQVLRALAAFLLGWLVLAPLYYLIPALYLGRGVLALSFIFSVVGIATFRPLYFKFVNFESLKPRVLVLGAGKKAMWIMRLMGDRGTQTGFRLVGFVEMDGPRFVGGEVPVIRLDEPLCGFAKRHRVDQIVVAMDDRRNRLPMQDLLKCRLVGTEVLELATFFERETGSVALELTDPSWLVFGQGFSRSVITNWLKRIVDILISVVLLVFSAPLVLLTVIAIKLEEGLRAPVIYSQLRVGEEDRLFRLFKLRSMRVNAEDCTGARWARANDDRVTRVGRVIRKLRVDELPQIYNVLRGDMSFVGPRPERPEFTCALEQRIRYYRERSTVKPGVTGWAQLRYPYGASDDDSREKLKYDLFYIKNHNMLFDMLILLQTVEVVIFGKGAR